VEQLIPEELYRARLATLETEAAHGLYGEPLRFLGAMEQEASITEVSTEFVTALQTGTHDREALEEAQRKYNLRLPEDITQLQPLTEEGREVLLQQYRTEARAYVAAIPAHDPVEEARRTQWLAEIDDFNTADIVNFRLYKEFSTPTLGPTAVPEGASYDEVLAYTAERGSIEFRFGKENLQRGWYDNDKMAEYRTTPCPPLEQAAREAIIHRRFIEIAAEHGAILTGGGRHISLSVYTADPEQLEPTWKPMVGWRAGREEATMAAVSGLSAAIEDGAWIGEGLAADPITFLNFSQLRSTEYDIAADRHTLIRLHGDYVELRDGDARTHESTAHGLLWLMAGVCYGTSRGVQRLRDARYTVATLAPTPVVHPTPHYRKAVDVQLRRAVESSQLNEHGGLTIKESHLATRGKELAQAVLGPLAPSEGDKHTIPDFGRALGAAIHVASDGRLTFDRKDYLEKHAMIMHRRQSPEPGFMQLASPAVLDAIETYINRDRFRVKLGQAVSCTARYARLDPRVRQTLWHVSPVVAVMYGDMADRYEHQVFDTADKHYKHIDPNNPDAVGAVIQRSFRQQP